MMSRILFRLFVAFLLVMGVSIAWLRHTQVQVPLLPGEPTPVWLVEARVEFTSPGGPATVNLDIPDTPPGFRILAEQTASPGYGFSVLEVNGNRRGEWSIRNSRGPQTLYYKVQIIPGHAGEIETESSTPAATAVLWSEPEALAAGQILETARSRSSTPESMARELIKELTSPSPTQNAALLLAETPRVPLLEKLLNDAGIPTRVVRGLHLEDGRRNQQLVPMLEIFARDHWVLFDPRTGMQGAPSDFLLWNQDGHSLMDVSGGRNSQVRFAMMRESISAADLARTTSVESGFTFFSVNRLPVEEQNMLRILLLLPVGALVVVFMRIMVGMETAGTFMPILIALSFLQTDLIPGLVSFVAVVAFGLLLRSYLSRLNLLLVARISTIIIIVIFTVVISSLLGYRLGFNTGMTLTFFPIIIIAWTIERMSILWEDEGPREVLVQGGGSLLVAILAYLLMRWPVVQHLSFHFPEVNLVTTALILVMGNYTGYKLLELRRFRAMRLKWLP